MVDPIRNYTAQDDYIKRKKMADEWELMKEAQAKESRARNEAAAAGSQELAGRGQGPKGVPPAWANNPDGYNEWLEQYKKQKARDVELDTKPRPGMNPRRR